MSIEGDEDVESAKACYVQIGFDYFTGKERCEVPEPSSIILQRGVVLASTWDKVLIQQEDGTCKVLGNTSCRITVDCKNIEDAVFSHNGLCFIENGNIKMMNFEKCDINPMNSVYQWRKISMMDSQEKIFAVTDKGQLYMLDDNVDSIPQWIPLIVRATDVSCGISHVIALADNGTLYTWGNGSRGQLGHGSTDDQHKPKLVDLLCGVRIIAIAAGGWHSIALADTGDVYVWGWNKSGQLGFPIKSLEKKIFNDMATPDEDSEVGMLSSPKLLELENYTKSENFVSIQSISCGSRHSVAVTTDGSAISWGWGKYGQLGQKCCVSPKTCTLEESESKKLRLNNNSNYLNSSGKCNADEHLPGLVDYFSHGRYRAVNVHCGRWCTYFSCSDVIS